MAILMEEGYWANSQYSIARYYGGVRVKDGSDNGKYHEMEIVNKQGITLRELSDPESKHFVKDGMAIKPGGIGGPCGCRIYTILQGIG